MYWGLVVQVLLLIAMAAAVAEKISEDGTDFDYSKSIEERARKCKASSSCSDAGGFCVKKGDDCEGTLDAKLCKGKKCNCCIPVRTTAAPPSCPPTVTCAPCPTTEPTTVPPTTTPPPTTPSPTTPPPTTPPPMTPPPTTPPTTTVATRSTVEIDKILNSTVPTFGGGEADKTIDDNNYTHWNVNKPKNYNKWYMEFKLKKRYTVTSIELHNYGDTTHDITSFKLEASDDGNTWRDLKTWSDEVFNGLKSFDDFTATGSYLKFTVTKTHSGWQPYLREISFTGYFSDQGSCVCGTVNRVQKITDGIETEVNEYPWQVALVSQDSSFVYCGGSLINDRWVLTAAHCTTRGVDQVILGNHINSQIDSAEMRVNIRSVVNNQNFNSTTLAYDFSLLELDTPLNLKEVAPHIRPVCLPSPQNPSQYDDVLAIITGWGTTSSGGYLSDVLLEATVRTTSNSQCNQQYDNGAILSSMICASFPGKDACQGDSGGPMVTDVDGYFIQIGVVSWGYGCANPQFPGVYSRVTAALSWIISTSSSGGTCAPPN